MNYYTELRNIIKDYKMQQKSELLRGFREIVWPNMLRIAKCGKTRHIVSGFQKDCVMETHRAGLLEKFTIGTCPNNYLLISWE